ncbi:MAG: response regulator [Terriglobales bacterium]
MKPLIVLADGSAQARRMGSLYLEDFGYEVAAVESAGEVLNALLGPRPRAILAAATLPDMSGAELCRQVKARPDWRDIPFLLLLGALAPAEPGPEILGQADGALRKPLSSAGLQQFLQPTPAEMLRLAVAEAARRA